MFEARAECFAAPAPTDFFFKIYNYNIIFLNKKNIFSERHETIKAHPSGQKREKQMLLCTVVNS